MSKKLLIVVRNALGIALVGLSYFRPDIALVFVLLGVIGILSAVVWKREDEKIHNGSCRLDYRPDSAELEDYQVMYKEKRS